MNGQLLEGLRVTTSHALGPQGVQALEGGRGQESVGALRAGPRQPAGTGLHLPLGDAWRGLEPFPGGEGSAGRQQVEPRGAG